MTSSARKAAFLGMAHGTATNRLRKMILLHLLKKLGENYCFKCRQEIFEIDQLSIEHKEPWEGKSIELFWDLNNIAFSHLSCNRPHSYQGGRGKRKVGTEGTAWCKDCKAFKPIDQFHKNASHWDGLHKHCKSCWSQRMRQRRMD